MERHVKHAVRAMFVAPGSCCCAGAEEARSSCSARSKAEGLRSGLLARRASAMACEMRSLLAPACSPSLRLTRLPDALAWLSSKNANYQEAEVLVRDATSNDSLGATPELLI